MNVRLDPRKLRTYRSSDCKEALHAPFVEFSRYLLGQVATTLDLPQEALSDCICIRAVGDTDEHSYTPDMITTWGAHRVSEGGVTDMCIAKQILEFTHDEFKDTGPFLSQRQKTRLRCTFTSVSGLRRKFKATLQPSTNSEPRNREETPSLESRDNSVDLSSRKRRHESDSASDADRPTKRPRFHRRARLASTAIECLSVTSRRWITGLLVDTCQVTACYFDRQLVACSSSFRFDQNPATLALVLYAMNVCSKDHAGFDPHLLPSPLDHAGPNHEPGSNHVLPVSCVIGSVFDFSFGVEDGGAACSALVSRDPSAAAEVESGDNEGRLECRSAAIGDSQSPKWRGGSAITAGLGEDEQVQVPLGSPRLGDAKDDVGCQRKVECPSAVEKSDSPGNGLSSTHIFTTFRILDVIRRPDELVGRATTVFKVQPQLPNGEFSDGVFALKLSWLPTTRVSEVAVIKHLKSVLPVPSHAHLPHLVFSETWTPHQLNLPWLELGLNLSPENHEERVLRALASRHYGKLWEVGSIENFKQAWIDCVEICHLAYRNGRVLHRDLSENNLMVLSLPNGNVKGVLNDWDLAKFIVEEDAAQNVPQRHTTGTPPFMAMDLLYPEAMDLAKALRPSGDPPHHWFRHDLESLFYILIWAALHYDLSTKTRDASVSFRVKDWTIDPLTNLAAKTRFFCGGISQVKYVLDGIKPGFEGVAKDWIKPLRRLFNTARHLGTLAEENEVEGYDPSTYGGELTFETFMTAIGVTPRTWGIPGFLGDDV